MRRRDFLYNTGLLLPALLAAPARLLASPKTIKTNVLIVQPETGVFTLPIQGRRLTAAAINRLEYSREGFLVTTNDNTLLQAARIILPAALLANVQRSSLEINTGQQTFHLNLAAAKAQYKTIPEVWFFQTQQFINSQANKMLTRKKHALIYLSNS